VLALGQRGLGRDALGLDLLRAVDRPEEVVGLLRLEALLEVHVLDQVDRRLVGAVALAAGGAGDQRHQERGMSDVGTHHGQSSISSM